MPRYALETDHEIRSCEECPCSIVRGGDVARFVCQVNELIVPNVVGEYQPKPKWCPLRDMPKDG